MIEFVLRDARHADRAAIGRLWSELMVYHRALDPRFVVATDGEEKYMRHALEMMRSRDGRVLVAEEVATGRVIGYVMAEIQIRPPMALPGVYGFISDIYISADWRRHGIAHAMFEELKHWFIARKATAVELYIADANPAAAAFWQAMGLTPFLRLMHMDL